MGFSPLSCESKQTGEQKNKKSPQSVIRFILLAYVKGDKRNKTLLCQHKRPEHLVMPDRAQIEQDDVSKCNHSAGVFFRRANKTYL